MEFEQWIDPGEVVKRVFGILPDQAKAIREEYPAPWTVSQGFGVTEVFSPTKTTEQLTFALQSEPVDNFEAECDCFRSSAVPSLADARKLVRGLESDRSGYTWRPDWEPSATNGEARVRSCETRISKLRRAPHRQVMSDRSSPVDERMHGSTPNLIRSTRLLGNC